MLLIAFVVLFCLILWLFSKYLTWGFYILVALAPMLHWQFRLNDWRFVLEKYPQFLDFYAPMVDVWASFMIAALAINLIGKWWRGEKINLPLPGVWFYGLFLFSALLSCLNLFPGELVNSLKYIIRFPLFVYLGFVVFGLSAISNKQILERAMKIFVGVSFLGALMGLASLFMGVWNTAGLVRAVPFAILGWAPFGDQHIFLAEVFIAALPMAYYFYYLAENKKQKFFWLSVFFFILLICLLTFSRAGWLTLFFMAIIILWLEKPQQVFKYLQNKIWFFVLMLLPFIGYMSWFLQSRVVRLSNEARIAITSIGWFLFKDHPFIGQGVGTFEDRISSIWYFVYEFGTPIDAHSILSKLLAEQGILGVVAFALFIGYFISLAYKKFKNSLEKNLKAEGLLTIVLISGPLFFQLFSTQYYSAIMWLPIVFGIWLCSPLGKGGIRGL
ncbi:MAG: hypothetical protein US42_C0013G0014 [Candidatus Magasanikbacteria bacterium GW2011_GWC2_37_14]|uniref:O-antigen ligase-related domain-containing protein n=1 Tax=Candidatus Magasanikbacteria bacterium GW2011_GWC2_37_14 TaxID=1619046 RepID=A0A0G0GM29_9BACT|nr:MAG: hypothetical protein US42_C0013G0014 [Candidatus Magasanikbacteria bacterium GW2011_GWC2_37_14]